MALMAENQRVRLKGVSTRETAVIPSHFALRLSTVIDVPILAYQTSAVVEDD